MVDHSTPTRPAPNTLLSDQPPFLTVQQASKLLHVSTWSLYQAIRSGELPVIRWGRRVVLEREDLASLVASKRDEGLHRSTRTSTRRFGSTAQHDVHVGDPEHALRRTAVFLRGVEPA